MPVYPAHSRKNKQEVGEKMTTQQKKREGGIRNIRFIITSVLKYDK